MCLDSEMAVSLENGAWIVEASGFFMRHQFGLRHELMTRVNAFYLLLVTELSGGYDQPYDAAKPSRKVRWQGFFTSRRLFHERDASSRQSKAEPFGRPSSPDGLAPATLLASSSEQATARGMADGRGGALNSKTQIARSTIHLESVALLSEEPRPLLNAISNESCG
jgi:hypothetical protein